MEIIKNFGINPYLLVAQIVNFLILLYLLKRFAFKPIMGIIEKRKLEIEEGLRKAEDGKNALEKALLEEKKILKKAQTESQKILSEAKNQAERIASEMKHQAKQQVDQLFKEAKERNSKEEKEMEKRVAMSAAKLAIKMVEKSISGVFTETEQEEAIKQFKNQLRIKE